MVNRLGFVLVFILAVFSCLGQTSDSVGNEIVAEFSQESSNTTRPSSIERPQVSSYLSTDEFGLTVLVLLFGVIVFGLAVLLIYKKILLEDQAMKILVIILVIISSLFLISAGFNSDQITPVIGLLGTIIGYLLGSNRQGG